MAIGSPPITWDRKHTGEPWVYNGTPLPNPPGNTGVMVCYVTLKALFISISDTFCACHIKFAFRKLNNAEYDSSP